jgi:hypothetical protein
MSYLRAFSQRPAKTSAVHSLVDALSSSLYVALYAGLSKEREEKHHGAKRALDDSPTT